MVIVLLWFISQYNHRDTLRPVRQKHEDIYVFVLTGRYILLVKLKR